MNFKQFLMSSMIAASLSSVKDIPILLVRTLPHFSPSSIWFRSAANWVIQCRRWPRTNCTGRPNRSSEVISRIFSRTRHCCATSAVVVRCRAVSDWDFGWLFDIVRSVPFVLKSWQFPGISFRRLSFDCDLPGCPSSISLLF